MKSPKIGMAVLSATLAVLGVAFLVTGRTSAHISNALFSHLSADQQECVEQALGVDVYQGLTDFSQVTNEMKVKMGQAGCFGPTVSQPAPTSEGQPPPTDESAKKAQADAFSSMSEEKRSCMMAALGEVRYKELSSGASFAEADKTAIEGSGCFSGKTKIGGEQIAPVKTNPFDDLHPSMVDCVKGAFGDARFDQLKNGAGFTDADQQAVEKAGCFKGEGQYKGDDKPEGIHPEVDECVKGILGEQRMNALRSAGTPPTPGEKEQLEECFSKDKKYLPNPVYAREGLPSEVDKCMRLALGDRYEDIKRGLASITEADRQAGYKCIGKANDPIAPPPAMIMSEDLKKCLLQAVGQERFDAISGGEEPTDEEKAKGMDCFKAHEKKAESKTITGDQLLPPPPAEVPYIKEDPKAIKVDNVTLQDGQTVIGGTTEVKAENFIVDVYVYSDPIQVTATADKNGQWSLVYDGKLPEGDHKIYAVIKKAAENVRSEAKIFNPAKAQAAAAAQTADQIPPIEAETSTDPGLYIIYIIGGVAIVGLVGLLIYLEVKKRGA